MDGLQETVFHLEILPSGAVWISSLVMGLRPQPCISLEMVSGLVLFLVMITLSIGFSLGFHPAKVSPSSLHLNNELL